MNRVKKIVHCDGNFDGQDLVVAIMDTGVSMHPDLDGRIWMFRDFVNGRIDIYDDNGHGTHVCGIIGGSRVGIAPKCKMIVLKVLDREGNGSVEQSMRAFRWILENQEKYNIRIVNISMGMVPHGNQQGERYILAATELLWNMGIIVVAAAGNLGPKPGSVTVPGVSSKIITVGSYDTAQSGWGMIEETVVKPDLVAPGNQIVSCNAFWKQDRKRYIAKSGTSMSTPIVTGAIAGLLSKEPNLTNAEVKRRLIQSCTKLPKMEIRFGNGLLNMHRLVKNQGNNIAKTYKI